MNVLAVAAQTASMSLWLSLGLPLGIALIGLGGTIGVMAMQLRARRKELQADRAERAETSREERKEREILGRAAAIEDIVAELAEHASVLNSEIDRLSKLNLSPDTRVSFPSNFKVKRALSRLSTKARERRLTDATYEMLAAANKLTLAEQPYVYGIMQERLEFWFSGDRSTDETLQIMADDAALFREGKLPPTTGTAAFNS